MAKKMSTGKVVALALCVIVGAGSIAALARGRDKDEDEVKEPAHVHDFSETNICADCGERQAEILFADVKEGMDLSGYTLRAIGDISEKAENFFNYCNQTEGMPYAEVSFEAEYDYSDFGIWIDDTAAKITYPKEVYNEDGELIIDTTATNIFHNWQTPEGEFYYQKNEDFGIPAVIGKVKSIVISDDYVANFVSNFKFVYVGYEGIKGQDNDIPETLPTAMSVRTYSARAPKTQTVSFWDSVNVSMAGVKYSEWTPIF